MHLVYKSIDDGKKLKIGIERKSLRIPMLIMTMHRYAYLRIHAFSPSLYFRWEQLWETTLWTSCSDLFPTWIAPEYNNTLFSINIRSRENIENLARSYGFQCLHGGIKLVNSYLHARFSGHCSTWAMNKSCSSIWRWSVLCWAKVITAKRSICRIILVWIIATRMKKSLNQMEYDHSTSYVVHKQWQKGQEWSKVPSNK